MKSKKMQALSAIMNMQDSITTGTLGTNENTDATSEGFIRLLNILNTDPQPTQDELEYISGQFRIIIKDHVAFLDYHNYCIQLGEVTQTEPDFWEIS